MDIWAPVAFYGPDGTGGIVADAGTFTTVSGRFRPSADATDVAGHGTAADVWKDAYAEITVTALSGTVRYGAWLRVTDANNCYYFYGDNSGGFTILKVVSGAQTSVLTGSLTLGTLPGVFRAEIQGTNLRCFWRGRFLGSANDTALVAPGYASMYLRQNAAATVDASRFEAGPLGAGYTPALDVQQAGPSTRSRRLR